MIQPAFEILNQRGTPMFFSDVYANIPTAGIVGRIFISTDTKEFYRDTGSTWELIGGPGSGTITGSGTAGQVAFWNGTSTITGTNNLFWNSANNSLLINGASYDTFSSLINTGKTLFNNSGQPVQTDHYNFNPPVIISGSVQSPLRVLRTGGQPNIFIGTNNNSVTATNFLAAFRTGAWYNTLSPTYSGDWGTFFVEKYGGSTAWAASTSGANLRFFQYFTCNGNTARKALMIYPLPVETASNTDFVNVNNLYISDASLFGSTPSARLHIVGDGNTSSSLSIYAQSLSGTRLMSLSDDGQGIFGPLVTGTGRLIVNNSTSDAHLQIIGANGPSIRIDNAGTGSATQRFVMGIATATNNFIQGSAAGNICISTASAGPMLFGMWQTINASEVMRITTANNLLLGTSVDGGQRFQVSGDTYLRGSSNTNSTYAISINNSDNNLIARFINNGGISFRTDNLTAIYPTNTGFAPDLNGNSLRLMSNLVNTALFGYYFINATGSVSWTSGSGGVINVQNGYNPSAGTGTFTWIQANGTINQTGTASGITRGLYITPTLTSAVDWRSIEWSNNTGWGLYGAGGANNYLGGKIGFSTADLTATATLRSRLPMTGGSQRFNLILDSEIQSSVTSFAKYFTSVVSTAAASFNLTNLYHYTAEQGTFGAGSAVSNQFGYFVDSTLINASNNYGFYSNIPTGTGRWNFYSNGGASNYFAGRTGFGSLNLTGYGIRLTIGHTGSTTTFGIMSEGVIANDVTGLAVYYGSSASSVSGFSLGEIVHYRCDQGSFGTSTITQQSGFQVRNTLTGATNNYGFRGLISSGTGRWNLFMDGVGANHMAGNLLLGSTTNPGQLLYVNGSIRVDGQTAATAGGSSGQHLIINCDGTTYKIALLNN